jgi:hypothetical protein
LIHEDHGVFTGIFIDVLKETFCIDHDEQLGYKDKPDPAMCAKKITDPPGELFQQSLLVKG